MTNLLTFRRTPLALLLAAAWACAQGQSLGTPMADALLGRPLAMTVPARFSGNDNDCVHADVFYGETRLSPRAVTATVIGPEDQRRIRIEASTPMNEPIVTVSVRAGCHGSITRNYTLLPDYPSEGLLAAADARAAMALATPAAAPTPGKAAPVPVAAHAVRKGLRKVSRLKLERIELAEPQHLLRVSDSLSEPTGDPARRALAALLWQAINADPQEVMRTTAMIHQLEQDLATLRLSSMQTRDAVAALRRRLDEAQPWYVRPGWAQVLALMVLGAAGAMGVLWWRMRDLREVSGPWFVPAESDESVAAPVHQAVVAPPRPAAVPEEPVAVPEPVRAQAAATGPIEFDVEVSEEPAPVPAPSSGHDGVLRVEALAATFEEVEFLSSLGLTFEAMEILKTYLQDSAAPAPVAYLELMRLCEVAEDPPAVATVRRRYAQSFGVEAPRLAQFTAEGGLDSLPALSARVVRTWGSGEVLAAIERVLFEAPTPAAPITRQAACELLALYELAIARASEPGAAESEAPLAPWAHAEDPQAAEAVTQQAADADGGHRFALDLDLSPPKVAPLPDTQPDPDLELLPLLAKIQAERRREQARAMTAEEDAFSAAVARERTLVSRY